MTVSSENPTIELGLWSRAVNIFTHPTRTFVSILDQPKVLGALLITLVFTFVGTLVTFDILYDAQIDAIYEVDSMAPEEQEKTAVTMDQARGLAQVGLPVLVTLFVGLTLVIWALLLHFLAAATMGNSDRAISFRHTFSLVAHAHIVNMPLIVLSAIVTLSSLEPFTGIHLGRLLGLAPQSAAAVAAAWVGPFNLWWLFLLGVGIAVTHRRPIIQAIAVPLAISLFFRVVQIGLAALGGSLGGSPAG